MTEDEMVDELLDLPENGEPPGKDDIDAQNRAMSLRQKNFKTAADFGALRSLQKARSRALNNLLRDGNIGVAHHEVDVFIMEPGTNQYLGRLCCFNECPKGKKECRVPGCGATPFLQLHEEFIFDPEWLKPGRTVPLYEKGGHPAGRFETEKSHL